MAVLVERDLTMTTADGVMLCADVYRPAGPGRWPVLLMRTPYGKGLMPLISQSLHPIKAAEAGFAVVVQDVRGRQASGGGTFRPYEHEREDGDAAVAWCAELQFCDGNVGMFGVSYMGGAAWLAAAARPEALRAIATAHAPRDLYAALRPGGALCWATLVDWSLGAIGIDALLRSQSDAPDLGVQLARMVDDIDGFRSWIDHRPITDFPPARPDLPDLLPFFWDYVRHEIRDEPWTRALDERTLASAEVPALVLASWHDMMLRDELRHFTRRGREHDRLLVGPWSHGVFEQVVGDLDFGLRASGLSLDLQGDLTSLHVAWFDRWLRDGDGTGPRVRIFVQGVDRWRDEDAWPPTRAERTPLYLATGGNLSWVPPAEDDEPSSYAYDPDDPCPTVGGALIAPLGLRRGPVDQRQLLDRTDVLSFVGQVLDEPVEVTGHVEAMLHVATDGPDTDWVVKLCDMHADGRVLNICDGILRASARNGPEASTPVTPSEAVLIRVDLGATSIALAPGHRLAVLVTSSDFPRYDRNPNTGEGATHVTSRVAHQSLFHDAVRPSHVVLPVIGTLSKSD